MAKTHADFAEQWFVDAKDLQPRLLGINLYAQDHRGTSARRCFIGGVTEKLID